MRELVRGLKGVLHCRHGWILLHEDLKEAKTLSWLKVLVYNNGSGLTIFTKRL